ncbi:MAG: SPOR domain-containing protein, partial [Candidatus Eiseniibacteriota bacterium]
REPARARGAASRREPVATDASGRGAPARREPVRTDTPPPGAAARGLGPTVPAPASAAGTTPATVAPVRKTFGLEVATFIFEERARMERDRLAALGLRARVVTTVEYGSRVYRVVLGGYPDPAAAERAADSLLSNGVILQARVLRVSSGP